MNSIRISTAATLAALALGAPAFAQDAMAEPMMMESGQAMMMESGQAMMAMPSGEMMMATMSEETMTTAMEGAEPVAEGTVFFVMDGQLMMATGMTMEDGTMMMSQ